MKLNSFKDTSNMTTDWQKYESGKSYNRKIKPINYYDNSSLNWDFYNSYQYPGLEDVDTAKPVFNIIKRLVLYFVSAITSTNTIVKLEPLAMLDDDEQFQNETNAARMANAQINNLFDHHRMPIKIRKALTDGAVSGDYAMHIYFDPDKKPIGGMFNSGVEGDICMELVDGANIYLGNANNMIISKETQPYVIVAGRDTVENLKKEAEMYRNKDATVSSDQDYEEQTGQGGKLEIDADEGTNKATYIYIYRYNNKGTVSVSKSTQTGYIYKDIDTELSEYPVAWGVWEEQKNQYHGCALVSGLIPNQIYINKGFALMMHYLINNAFQKPVYDADRIAAWTSEIDVAIPVRGLQPGESVRNVAAYLDNGAVNPQVLQTIDAAIKYTLEFAGATEAALGNIKPDNTSAIIAVTRQSAIPLENPRANMKEWVNDIVKILLDMMGTKYGVRPVVVEEDGQKRYEMFDFSTLKNLNLNTKIQVGDGSYFSEIAALQTLDNLMAQDRIDAIEYFERIEKVNPDYIPDISGLINKRKEQQEMMMQQPEGNDVEAMADFVASLPPEQQQEIMALPEDQREQVVMKIMQGGTQNAM